ncbi:MAG: hypothetical protein SF070_18145, partial [Gemmatimonadota bacterium]|nr:hypothetical protein [Gemmatimonadota bacterium]
APERADPAPVPVAPPPPRLERPAPAASTTVSSRPRVELHFHVANRPDLDERRFAEHVAEIALTRLGLELEALAEEEGYLGVGGG